ncbi:MAG: hypothetical protein WC358_04060 [Ignavibacteria bacterium]|jgi:phenylacetate-CoA ligase
MVYNNKIAETLYFISPHIIKNCLFSLYGFSQKKGRYGGRYKYYYDFLTESQFWDSKKLQDYQKNEIEKIIDAIKDVPIYRDRDLKSIAQFPILSKDNIRSDFEKYLNIRLKKIPHKWNHTSGTSGQSLVFPLTVETLQREYAFRAIHYSWAGVSLTKKEPIAMVAGHPVAYFKRNKPPFWTYDFSNNWLLFSSYHLTEDNLKYYVKELDKFSPVLIHGYPSSIYLLSLAYKKWGLNKLKLKGIFTASETLLDYQRKEIESTFQVKIFNWYGNSEMTANIVECEKGELHLKYEHSYVEILKNDNTFAKPGEIGRLICTAFTNIAFPLIRYDIGDVVKISENQNSKCGRGGLIIDSIEGRKEDYIFTPDGRIIGRLDHLFKDSVNIIEAQIYQDNIESVELKIVVNNEFSKKDEEKLLRESRLRLGDSIKIKIEIVPFIQRNENGKFRFIISKLYQNINLK